MDIIGKIKRDTKDLLIIFGIGLGILIVVGLILGGVAFELLKAWALIKFIFFW